MDKTRALLDSLMGPNRDVKTAADDDIPGFADKSVCKHYLAGFCPFEYFTHARRSVAACEKIHSEIMREQLDQHPDKAAYRAEYEEDYLLCLEVLVRDCDQFIIRELSKTRGPVGKVTNFPADVKEKYDALESQYGELIAQSEGLADESLTRSREKMNQAISVKADMDALKVKYTTEGASDGICEVCGVRYPMNDVAHDKTSHYRGKTHEGFTLVREKVQELRGRRKQWDKQRSRVKELQEKRQGKEKDKAKEDNRKRRKLQEEQERERAKEREKEAARERSREREREKEKEREKRREKERELEKEKERQRREKEKEKEKESHSEMSLLWDRMQHLPTAQKKEMMTALSEEERDRLEEFLVARVATQRG